MVPEVHGSADTVPNNVGTLFFDDDLTSEIGSDVR